jgi:signal transduction histidine kinase
MKGLDPVAPGAGGLQGSLTELAEETSKVFHVACRADIDGSVSARDDAAAAHLYYIAREAVHNAVRHGKARNVFVGLTCESGRLILEVRDDGVGLTEHAESSKGLGMRTMRYRAGALGAQLTVESQPDGGTVVRCALRD